MTENKTDIPSICSVIKLGQLGDDLGIVNSARISYDRCSTEFSEKDVKLLNYLAKHKHMSPFRHGMIQLRIRAPEFVARQAYKHKVGIETTSTYVTKDDAWNEISGRYLELKELYTPATFSQQSESSKQGSGQPLEEEKQKLAQDIYSATQDTMMAGYRQLLDLGVSREQARLLLPVSFMTEWTWTATLESMFHFVQLRKDKFAQHEIQDLAIQIDAILQQSFPHSYHALQQSLL